MYTRCDVILILLIKDFFTPIKHLEFLHFSFCCYPPGSDQSIPYLDHSRVFVTYLPSTVLAPSTPFFTPQYGNLSMSLHLTPFNDLFIAP